jgi:hypothetical protein
VTEDARFEDGREAPLNLGALDAEDLQIVSALSQDAVFQAADLSWQTKARRFVALLNRFRWEDAARSRHGSERVRSLLVVDHVLGVESQGFDRRDTGLVLSILSVTFDAGEDGTGQVLLTLAGDGQIRISVEALEITLKDVTRPYAAVSGQTPSHD